MITQTVTITQNATPNIIIGRRGTYETKQVIFDVSWLRSSYGEGTATLLVKRPTDVTAYPVAATLDGTTLTWTVSDTDTSYKGHGECEIFWYVNGGLAKSCICGVTILRDIGDTTETAPDPYETWIETLTALGSETLANAQSAAQSASDANQSAEDASNSAAAALESEENALNSENAAKASEQAAAASEANALASEQAAKASENAAALSEGNARQSANAAYQSAGIAANSATQAATSASEAQGYVSEASVQADRAEQAADNIESNVQRAEAAAQSAQNAASDANGFAGAASTKATEAAASASSASSSAVAATQKASDASASATAAASSATAANTAKAAAETAQGKAEDAQEAAETAATNAQASADDAAQSAQEAAREIIKAFPHDTASGSIANFPDGAALPVRNLSVDIEPVQDLNGYDNPWPAGGGKNIYPNSSISGSAGGITVTHNVSDESYTISGLSSAYRGFLASSGFTLKAGTYTLSRTASSGTVSETNLRMELRSMDGLTTYASTSDTGPFTFAEDTEVKARIVVGAGSVDFGTGIAYRFQLESGSSPSTWVPYSNICPITGHTEVNVTRTGKNLLKIQRGGSDNGITCTINNDGSVAISGTATGTTINVWFGGGYSVNNKISRVYAGETVTVTDAIIFYHYDGKALEGFGGSNSLDNTKSKTFTFQENGWIDGARCPKATSGTTYSKTIYPRLEVGSTATAYEPYQGETYTIDLDGTRYGGTLDVATGKLTVDRVMLGNVTWTKHDLYSHVFYAQSGTGQLANSITGVSNVCVLYSGGSLASFASDSEYRFRISDRIYINIPSVSNVTDLNTWITNNSLQICFELATPIVYDLTPTEVTTLLGTNNIFADCGDTTVDYYADPTLFVNKKIAAAVAAMS